MEFGDTQILQGAQSAKRITDAKSVIYSVYLHVDKYHDPELLKNNPDIKLKIDRVKSNLTEAGMWLTHMLTLLEQKIGEVKPTAFPLDELNSTEKLSFLSDQLQTLITDKKLIGVIFHQKIRQLEIANDTFYIKLCDAKNWIKCLMNHDTCI